jgi:hypothetical protein
MNQLNTNKVASGIIAAVIIALLLSTVVFYRNNAQLKETANRERLQSEKLLSEKLLLMKEIEGFRGEITSLKGKNKEADILLEKANRSLNEQENTIHSLSKEAASAKQLKKQLADVKKIRENLISELEQLTQSKNELSKTNTTLKNQNDELTNDVNKLLAENKSLAEQLRDKSFAGTNFKIEVVKNRKDKLTVKARRTDKIKIEFEVAANTYPVDSSLIHVDLLSPDKTIPAGDIKVSVANQAQLSANIGSSLPAQDLQKVIIEYTPKEKLNQGVYTVLVFHKNTFLGKAQFRLMK